MGKYEPLGQFLRKQKRDRIAMSFADIERLIAAKLPKSSKSHRAWWSNNPTNNVMTKEWLDAGFETVDVELDAERLVFRKSKQASSSGPGSDRKSIFGCMKGMVTLPDDFDPERPFHGVFDWEEWEREKFGSNSETT
jgi:hypothetical protein